MEEGTVRMEDMVAENEVGFLNGELPGWGIFSLSNSFRSSSFCDQHDSFSRVQRTYFLLNKHLSNWPEDL